MSQNNHPLLSVIARKFPKELEQEMDRSVQNIQGEVIRQPGFVGLQNSFSHQENHCELVTVFTFDSEKNLEKWKASPIRAKFVAELDQHSYEKATHAQFNDLSLLLSRKMTLSKIEMVIILVFWILLLGACLRLAASALFPEFSDSFWLHAVLVSINVLLISYFFLPWSSRILIKVKSLLTLKKE